MPQLKNPKHELMARALIKGKSKTAAYLEAHPNASYDTARKNASAYMAKYGIHARSAELLSRAGLTEEKLAKRLKDHVESKTESISLDATKAGLKLYGHGVAHDRDEERSYEPVAINIIVRPDPSKSQIEQPKVIEHDPKAQDGQSENVQP